MRCNDRVKRLLPSLLVFIFLLLPFASAAESCLTSSEEYAVEVVVPNYDFSTAIRLTDRVEGNNVKPSEYSENSLLTIIKETELPDGLSIRVQLPTEIKEVEQPYIKILSSSAQGQLPAQPAQTIASWSTSCGEQSCTFMKGDLSLTAARSADPEVTLEISRQLNTCSDSCSGFCFSATSSSRCMDMATESDINNLLRFTRLATNTRELFESYRVVGTENIVVLDVVPTKSTSVDWEEAMRQELVALASKGAISVSNSDIEQISQLAARGQAGQNYRVVYDADSDNWQYYDTTDDAILTDKRDCQAYKMPSEGVKTSPESTRIFYLVPLIITLSGILLLGLLAVVAHIINRKKSHPRKKHHSAHHTEHHNS